MDCLDGDQTLPFEFIDEFDEILNGTAASILSPSGDKSK
jgi:hypothetical protein